MTSNQRPQRSSHEGTDHRYAQCADDGCEWQARRGPSRRWAAISTVCRKLGRADSLIFFKLDMYFTAAVRLGETGEGKGATKVELDWLFTRVSPGRKYDHQSSSATGY